MIFFLQVDQCSIGSGDDYGSESLRTKLSTLREKNTLLVSQNHKLMSELENMGYDLHQEHSNVSREKYLQFKVYMK